jgi:hypothetical protein
VRQILFIPPFEFECIHDPLGRPALVEFEICQNIQDLKPFCLDLEKRPPYESGVTKRDKVRDALGRASAGTTYCPGVL